MTDTADTADTRNEAEDAPGEGRVLDYLSGEPVKDTPKEQVRQRIVRALFIEYGISADDMETDFSLKVGGRRKRADIAIFKAGAEHAEQNLRRVVLCKPEPKQGAKRTFKLRDHEQAEKDLQELQDILAAVPNCRWGLWTNGIELFFIEKQEARFDVQFSPIGDWPLGDESLGSRDVVSEARMRRASREMLLTAFRRCHNFIHGNEGMPKDAAFWQFLYLIFAKMFDERKKNGARRFWTDPREQFDPEGRKAIRARVMPLFDEVKLEYPDIFSGREEITLSDRALAFMVSELARYDFSRTGVDVKGAAYQELVGTNLRGDRGQYFTPRGAIKLMVQMLDPKPHERLLDPACGTGGFLVEALGYLNDRFHREANVEMGVESTDELLSLTAPLRQFAKKNLFGADFDPFLVRAAQMNVVMAAGTTTRMFHMNSLEFPRGDLDGLVQASKLAALGTMDVVMTNPPFGSDIPVTDPRILEKYDLAHVWERAEDGGYRRTGRRQGSVAPEVLFVERCVAWLKEGGRMGIVLPNGILGNPSDEYIRWWLLHHCWVLASVELPVETFIHEAGVNILTSLLFLKKKTDAEVRAEDLGKVKEYPVFMAVAEKVGIDRRGAVVYVQGPEGEDLLEDSKETERIRIGGKVVSRTLRRKQRIVDDDLPRIAAAYAEFRRKHLEPGA